MGPSQKAAPHAVAWCWVLCCGAEWCQEPAPTPQALPRLWGLTLDPATPPPSWHLLLVVALHKRGVHKVVLSNMPKYSPNGRKLSWSHSHVWREAVLDGSLIFLVLTTKSESLKGKILTAISKAPWMAFSDHPLWTSRTPTNGVHCLRVQEEW